MTPILDKMSGMGGSGVGGSVEVSCNIISFVRYRRIGDYQTSGVGGLHKCNLIRIFVKEIPIAKYKLC